MTSDEQPVHDHFAVYFDGSAYARKMRIGAAISCVVTFLLWFAKFRNSDFPKASLLAFLVTPLFFMLLAYISHRFHDRNFRRGSKPRQAWLEMDGKGIQILGSVVIPWENISSLECTLATDGPGRLADASYLILNFPDSRILDSLPARTRLDVTVRNIQIKLNAKARHLTLSEHFAAIPIKGGSEVPAHLTASDTLIEAMAKRYYYRARAASANIATTGPALSET